MTVLPVAAAAVIAAVAWPGRPHAITRRPTPATGRMRPVGRRPRPMLLTVTLLTIAAIVTPESALLAIAGGVGWRALRPHLAERRRLNQISAVLPDAIDLLVLTVRAGLSPGEAIREMATVVTAPIQDGFAQVVHRLDRGFPFDEAVRALSDTLGPAAHGLVDVITTTTRYGLPLEPVLDQLTDEARAARRRRQQADARKLPIRLSFPLVVCALPSFVLLAVAPAVIAALSSLGSSAW